MRNYPYRLALACGMLLACWTGPPARAASIYPTKAITLIVPFAAGGPTDLVARIIAEGMSDSLQQPIVVENVVGAGGTIAAVRAKRAAPDGYTIMMGHMGTHAAAVALFANLTYDPSADFEPIGMTASMAVVVLARRDFPAADFRQFAAYLRDNSARLTMGHAGVGSVSFATCLMLNSIVGADPKLTAFQGTGPAMVALVGRHLDYMCDQVATAVGPVRGGGVKAYAVSSAERNPALPDVPTSAQAGMPEFQVRAWNALFAPKGTPPQVIAALNAALVNVLASPDTRRQLLAVGSAIPSREEQTPQALAALVQAEVLTWKSILASARDARTVQR